MAKGSVYRPTYRARDGSLKHQRVYWLAYYQGGKLHRRGSGTTNRADADRLLRELMREADAGAPAESGRLTLETLRDLELVDLTKNGRRSTSDVRRSYVHLLAHFGRDRKARRLTVADVDAYAAARLEARAAAATVNLELAHLRRGFRLAIKKGLLSRRPEFSLLTLHNRRTGFFEREDFDAILRHLPEYMRPMMEFLWWTGWRAGEAQGLEWRQVDRKAGVIRIETSKSGEPRTIPYKALPTLEAVIETQRQRAAGLQRGGRIVRHVFFGREGGPLAEYNKAWKDARTSAGLPGKLVHDLRRTAARRMLRAGIPQPVAMLIGGWKTDHVFRRYAIVDENVLAENLAKLAEAKA
jgi:integrase